VTEQGEARLALVPEAAIERSLEPVAEFRPGHLA